MEIYPNVKSKQRSNGDIIVTIELSEENFVRIAVDSKEQALMLTCVDRIPAIMPKASNQVYIKTIEL